MEQKRDGITRTKKWQNQQITRRLNGSVLWQGKRAITDPIRETANGI
jgi:hypothetical protein